jgi:hypothetical protein
VPTGNSSMSIDPWTSLPPPPPARIRGARFSLAALVLLVTTSGVVFGAAAAASGPQPRWHLEQVLANAAIGLVMGALLGGYLAASYELHAGWTFPSVAAGLLAGAIAGALSGCEIHLPTALVGSAVLIGVGGLCRLLSARREHPAAPP